MDKRIDYLNLWEHFSKMKPGSRAEIRRVAHPEELDERPVFYRLISGLEPGDGIRRVIYCLPWVEHAKGKRLGAELARAKINERRLFQVMRSSYPNDVIQLRRLLQHASPSAAWDVLGPILFYWSKEHKRRLLEDYYINGNSINSEAAV